MVKTKQDNGLAITNWSEVDWALREIGTIDRELSIIDATLNELVDHAKEDAKRDAMPLQARKAEIEKAMQAFAEANKGEFSKVRNKQFTFGEVFFRLTSKVKIKRGTDVLPSLKTMKLFQCIRTKEEVDKEALRKLPSDTLAKIGARLETDDVFGYQINAEKIEEAT